METGVKLDFAIDWARSTKAEASSVFEVVPGGGTVEEEGFRAGVPVSVRWPSDITSGSGSHGVGSGSRGFQPLPQWRRVEDSIQRNGEYMLGPLVWEDQLVGSFGWFGG